MEGSSTANIFLDCGKVYPFFMIFITNEESEKVSSISPAPAAIRLSFPLDFSHGGIKIETTSGQNGSGSGRLALWAVSCAAKIQDIRRAKEAGG